METAEIDLYIGLWGDEIGFACYCKGAGGFSKFGGRAKRVAEAERLHLDQRSAKELFSRRMEVRTTTA